MKSDQQLISELRLAMGLKRKGDGGIATQQRVADALKVPSSRISEVLNGRRALTEDVRARILRRLEK